jgi:hypothetical protein
MTTQTYSMTALGGAVRRIRSPHPNDVLSGRGGGINAHEGNKRFREQVALRKEDYNLAPNKAEKTRIATEVMETILHQNPPGRFLQRDESMPSGPTWWVEVNEAKALAKTSQALREGAPQIRLAHQDEVHERDAVIQGKAVAKRKAKQYAAPTSIARPILEPTGETSNRVNIRGADHPVLPTAIQNHSPFSRSGARMDVPAMSVKPTLKVASQRLPPATYDRVLEQLEENARMAQSLANEEELAHQQQQQPRVDDIGIIAPLTSNKEFAQRYMSPPSKRPRSDPAQYKAYASVVAATEPSVDVMADTPPLIPAPVPINTETNMTPFSIGSRASCIGLKRYGSNGLRQSGRGLTRTHSLAFSDVSSSDLFVEYDDDFVNPFADESDVASKIMLPLDDNTDGVQSTATTAGTSPDTPGTMLRNLSSGENVNGGNITDIPLPFVGSIWATTSR